MHTTENPVSGGDDGKGAADGVSGAPGEKGQDVHGRTEGGESGDSSYPNPQTGRSPTNSGMMGHGGRTEIGYQAGKQGGDAPNAATHWDSAEGAEEGATAWTVPTYAPHSSRPATARPRSWRRTASPKRRRRVMSTSARQIGRTTSRQAPGERPWREYVATSLAAAFLR